MCKQRKKRISWGGTGRDAHLLFRHLLLLFVLETLLVRTQTQRARYCRNGKRRGSGGVGGTACGGWKERRKETWLRQKGNMGRRARRGG
ncbi:hypothetical protein B0H11DRAFT_2106885 [Mycena galericulata]|nr:hypothetical protein B0H11DRAFT_2106885 [Mycena galericulata]